MPKRIKIEYFGKNLFYLFCLRLCQKTKIICDLARFKELNMEKVVVGRHKEKEKLTHALSSHRSELIAVLF
jgi:hypothetical protein